MEKWLSIIGSIISIVGAFWAVYEAIQASKAASKAKVFRDEIINRRKMVEVSQIHLETQRILRSVSRIGPSSNEDQIKGISCSGIAKEVEEYSRFLNEQRTHFSEFFENKARDLCTDLNQDIEELSEATTFEEKKKAGKSIYYKINSFMPTVKELVDDKKERATTNE